MVIDPNFPQSSVPTCILGYYLRLARLLCSLGSCFFQYWSYTCFCASYTFQKDERINLLRIWKNFLWKIQMRLNTFRQKMPPPPIPRSNLCICGSLQFYLLLQHLIFRSKTPTKSRTINKSTKTTPRSKKGPSKARVVWVDNAVPQDTQHESNSDAVTNSTEFESSKYSTPSKCPFSHSVQWFFEFIALSGAESYAITELVSVFSKNQIPLMT